MKYADELERLGRAIECQDERMRVFTKWELPFRMHATRSQRFPNLILDLDISWRGTFDGEPYHNKGTHGWDNLYEDMQAIFIGYGPSFKKQLTVRPFENIQLYNLMCALVNVTPSDNEGLWGALHHLLVDPPAADESINSTFNGTYFPPFPLDVNEYRRRLARPTCALFANKCNWEEVI